MPMQFTPAAFVRHVPSKFLQDYFAKRRQLYEIDWDQLSPSDSKLVHEAILQLPLTQVREIHGDFRAVWEMAAREYACWLIQVAREHGVDLTVAEQRKASAYERAFRVFLDHPAVFEQARALAHWENLPRRSTERRNGMPKKAPVVTEVTLEQFAANLSKYYQQAQGRGEHCKVEHFVRGGHLDYFFVYPADYIDTQMCFEEDGSLIRKQWKPAFEVVVLFDRTTGSADLYAEGNAEVRENVAAIFAQTVLGHEAIPRRIPKPPYDLQPLLNPQFRFPTRPEDRILYMRLKAIRVKRTSDDERVTFEATGRNSRRNAAALLDEGLDEQRWPRETRRVTQVGIQAAFERGPHRPRIVNFTITHPAGCSLRDSEEELILRRCLRDGGITNNE